MQETTVRPVADKHDFKQFIDFQYERNRDDSHFIPPLRLREIERLTPRKNPFFAHADVELLLAHRAGRVCGRMAAIDDHLHNRTHGDSVVAPCAARIGVLWRRRQRSSSALRPR